MQTLFAGNVPFEVVESDLEHRFSEFGEVAEAHVLRDAAGHSRGMAIVEMASAAACERALVAGAFRWLGRTIYLRPRRSRQPKTQSRSRRTHWSPMQVPAATVSAAKPR
jgi:RNA recognition motif-containing protein